MMENAVTPTKITFFMPVTEKDITIADYCVRSYAKIRGIPFSLVIYLNYISERFKENTPAAGAGLIMLKLSKTNLAKQGFPLGRLWTENLKS
jgi:hypothetical protein